MKSIKLNVNGIELVVVRVLNSGHAILEGGIQIVKHQGSWSRKANLCRGL